MIHLHNKLQIKENYYNSIRNFKSFDYKDHLPLYNYPKLVYTSDKREERKQAYSNYNMNSAINLNTSSHLINLDTVFGRFTFCDVFFDIYYNEVFHDFIDCVCANDYNGGRRYDFSLLNYGYNPYPVDYKEKFDFNVYLFMYKMKWHKIKKNCVWYLPYRFAHSFQSIDYLSPKAIITMFLIMSGVETNPGPVMSKFAEVNCLRNFRKTVDTQGLTDYFSFGFPDVNKFTKDFSDFVGKIPEKHFIENSIDNMSMKCSKLVDLVETTFSQLNSHIDTTCSNIDDVTSEAKKIIIGVIAVLIIYYIIKKFGFTVLFGSIILGFVIKYFGIFENLENVVLDNGKKFWDYLSQSKQPVIVDTNNFSENVCHSLLDPSCSNLFSAIFTSICVYAVGQAPGIKDFADLSRKLFDYNKGATAAESIFEKAKNFWTYMVEYISFKMGVKESGGRVTKYSFVIHFNDWVERSTKLFKEGFGDIPDKDGKTIEFDERKKRRNFLYGLYNEGLDFSKRSNLLSKDSVPILNYWNKKIDDRINKMSTEAMNGEMRNPPTVMLMYGRSGVGKTSMVDGIKALASAVISEVEGMERSSSSNVYVRNSDMDHWDGYHAQQFVLFDDLGCRKDSEQNPNLELKELIGCKNSQPYPLPMAHLEDKGKFFTSQFIFCTTNVENMSAYIKSMTYSEAIVNRLAELSYICRVKPQYRKPMTAEDIAYLKERQIHDQHYVDISRTQYDIPDDIVREKFGLDFSLEKVQCYLTQEQFDSIKPDDIRRHPDGRPKRLNYDIYYFEPLNMRTGKACGPPIEWRELCNRVEEVIRSRLSVGASLLDEQKALHLSSIEDIKAGKITIKVQGVEDENQDDDEFFPAAYKFQNDDLGEGEDIFLPTSKDFLGKDRKTDLRYCVKNSLFDSKIPVVAHLIRKYGDSFHLDLLQAHFDLFQDNVEEINDEEMERMNTKWKQIYNRLTTYQEKIKNVVNNMPVMRILKTGGVILGLCAYVYLMAKLTNGVQEWLAPDLVEPRKFVQKEIEEQTKHLPWWKRLFNTLGSPCNPIKISSGKSELTEQQIYRLWDLYNLAVHVEGYGTYEPQSQSRSVTPVLRASVASMGFNTEKIKEDLESNYKNIEIHKTKEGLDIDFKENLIHNILVTCQSNQLTQDAISHVLPSNTYMMDYIGLDGVTRSIGNVTFLHDRALLMPYHYIQHLEHDVKYKKTLDDNCVFIFSRAATHLELGKNVPANKMKCFYSSMKNYKRITAPVFIDDVASMEKDAVVVYLSGSGISGHNCANIIKKFISRSDLAKVNSSGLSGYLVVQRNVGIKTNISTDIKERVVLGCSSITPVNVMRRTSSNWFGNAIYDFEGTQCLRDAEGKEMIYKITLRDRYEYTAGAIKGDCGSVLWIDHPQLEKCIVGMHSTAHPLEGKGCSVPICREDIEETLVKMGQCNVNAFIEPELTPLNEKDIFGVNQLVPQGNFQYIGKLEKDIPTQPIKTSILRSPVQDNLYIMQNEYSKKTGKEYPIQIAKTPAVMRVQYQNPKGYYIYEDKGKIFFRKEGEISRECSYSDYQVWLAQGGIRRDPLHEGLAKCSQQLPLIRPELIDEAVSNVAQKMLKIYNPLCVDPFSKAMAQNNFYLNETILEKVNDVQKRNKLIYDFIIEECPDFNKFKIKNVSEKLLRTISLDKQEIFVLKRALEKNYEGIEGLDLFLLDFANHSRYIEMDILSKENFVNPMILTIEQSISGIDGDKTIRSINAKKSPGYPWCTQRKPFGKKFWVGKEIKCDGEGYESLKKSVLELIEQCKYKIPEVYFIDTMKDELRTLEKVKNFKTRIFSAGPMHFSIVFRMYFMRFLSFMMENKIDNESAIGINPYSTEWEKLANILSTWSGPTCIAGDYSNFDGSLNNQIMEKLLDIVEKFYEQYGSTQEERTIRKNLWLCLTRSLHIGRDGGVYRWYNSQPSGNPYTTCINVLFNMVVFRIVYSLIFGKATPSELIEIFPLGFPFKGPPPRLTLSTFDINVKFIAYGDDNCANINPDIIHWFNMNSISQAMKLLGLTYTDEFKNKEGEIQKARFLNEINFLKRGFKQIDFQGRKWIAPLDIETIKEIPMWVRTTDSIRKNDIMIDNIKGTCMEMCLHGEQAYNDWVLFLTGLRHKSLLGQHFPILDTYYDQFQNTCNEVMDF